MSFSYYFVDKEKKSLVRIGRSIEDFEEGALLLRKLYDFMEENSERDMDIKLKDLDLKTLQLLLDLWDLTSKLNGALLNATLLSMAYVLCSDEKSLADQCIGEDKIEKYKGYKIIG